MGAYDAFRGFRHALDDLADASYETRPKSERLRRLRWVGGGLWLVCLLAWCIRYEPPLKTGPLFLWLVAALAIASAGNPLGWAKGMVVDWLPLYLILATYRVVWGLVDDLGIEPHLNPQHAFDTWLFGSRGATDRLLQWFWRGEPAIYDYIVWFVYLTHFWVTLSVAAILWTRRRTDFLAYRRRVVTTWLLALAVFLAYPTVPPWMAADLGRLPEMTRVLHQVRHAALSGSPGSSTSFTPVAGDDRMDLYNPVAAVPSLHSAMPVVLLLTLWPLVTRRWARTLLLAYPIAMGVVLVYTGDHYLFDILAGWALACLVHALWLAHEHSSRRQASDGSTMQPTATDTTRLPAVTRS